ncbi:hypothetical protein [Paludisphaera rhizosphaerae]|uniref:hypothetical protein n=1 Tax=Paludisphaera rhizosphaerae TaxID=2711216 RepID=UPI0013ECEF99|nr:hypothetical protein [Paludisphaera rhizosphaerae]
MAKRPKVQPTGTAPRLRNGRGEDESVFNWTHYVPGSYEGDLAQEIETYARHLDELVSREGHYVLIKGDALHGIFERREEAAEVAFQLFGEAPVLIKQILRLQPVADMAGVTP